MTVILILEDFFYEVKFVLWDLDLNLTFEDYFYNLEASLESKKCEKSDIREFF